MAGKLVVSTLNNDTGVLATQNGMTGICKAWVNFTGSTGVIRGSFNVSSVTRGATGQWTITMTTALADANYAVIASSSTNGGAWPNAVILFSTAYTATAPTTTVFKLETTLNDATGYTDPTYVCAAVLGN